MRILPYLAYALLLFCATAQAEPTFANPLVEQRADPQVALHSDGYYYFTATAPEYDRIELRRARSLDGLGQAPAKVVWRKHASGAMGAHIWAPELHHIDGKWYLYFTAAPAESIWEIRLYVLENSSANPLEGEWTERGQLKTGWESFALDATTFAHRGQRYLVWTQRPPKLDEHSTNIYIARMDTPTSITGQPVMLSRPDYAWEKVTHQVNEAPAVLVRNGKVFLTYSASATGASYCLGLLTADAGADLLDPASWRKSAEPVFATSAANGQYGPGHNSFTTTPDGKTDILVYHARNYRDIQGDPLNDPNRHTRAQVIHWRADGSPDFGAPVADRAQPLAAAPVKLAVDATQIQGPMTPIWAWYGYDEPNYTTAPNGKKLLSDIAALSPAPVYVRAHNLMTSGDGSYALKWGSTGMYSEDKDGKPVYNWTIIDQIFDTYIARKMKPLAEIGFMPEALSQRPRPYQHHWKPGTPYADILTGWATPPKDYDKWAELIYQWVKHSVARYGQREVESWYWEVWNEPDGLYLIAPDTKQAYFKMYDVAADAVKRALPTARIGGPHTAGAGRFMDDFLQHCLHEQNLATGKTGSPLDFVAFHAKGAPRLIDGVVQMGMNTHFKHLDEGFALVEKYPELKGIPVIIGESDPEGCAACGMQTNPENAYRNGTLYASYTAASIAREYELAARRGVNLIGAVNWSFEFEDQPWYAGFRDLATNGVNKPVLNVLRMFGMMRGQRVAVSGDQAYDTAGILANGVRGARTDINALASRDPHQIAVMVWNYHDDDRIDAGSPVELHIAGIPAGQAQLRHYRVDNDTSNSYSAWKRMGSPASPDAAQIAQLLQASELAQLQPAASIEVRDGQAVVNMQLPRQAVSLLTLTY